MNVLILQASPRAKGNTAWMADEYKNAAEAAGHSVTLVNVAHKHIAESESGGFLSTAGRRRGVRVAYSKHRNQ